jgi:anti-sigma-K factor RskA
MSDDQIFSESEGGDDMIAAECALGLLDGIERETAERRRLREPSFDRAVEAWQERLAGLTRQIAPVSPPPTVWAGILKQVESSGAVVELRLRKSLAAWRAAAASAASIAAALAVALVWPHAPALPGKAPLVATVEPQAPRPGQPELEQVMTARMVSKTGPTVFVVMVDARSHAIVVTPASVAETPGRSPELWLIPKGGKPIPLGLAAFGRSVRLSPDVQIGDPSHAILALSMEPLGGSPTGQPTGPVVATGALERT